MNKYEIMFILKPTLDEAKREASCELVKSIIEEDGKVLDVNTWGMKKLAYPIEDHLEGHYVVMDFESSENLPKELDRRLKISDDFMRHMIIRKEDK